jgi:hypothetical protein
MTFSLDLHAHEKKTQNDVEEWKQGNTHIINRMDTNENLHHCLNSKINTMDFVLKTLGMYKLSKEMHAEKEKYNKTLVKQDQDKQHHEPNLSDVDNYGL